MGAAAALGAAALWAVTNLILRGQVTKIGPAAANGWRTTFSALSFAVIFLLLRRPDDIFAIESRTLAALLGSMLLSLVIGDILQFTAIARLGVALAMPINSCYPIFTLIIAAITLGEPLTVRAVLGALLVVVGVILVALPRRPLDDDERARRRALTRNHWIGVAVALTAAVCTAFSTALMRVAIKDLDTMVANMIRLPISAILCSLIGTVQRRALPWRIERRRFGPLLLAGVVSMASGVCYLTAIQQAGAAKTATLNASAPIFGLLGAVLILRERPANRNILGTIIAFAGIALVV